MTAAYEILEGRLCSLMARVGRRQMAGLTEPEDSVLNGTLYKGLHESVRLTHIFAAAHNHQTSLRAQAKNLEDFSKVMLHMAYMISALERADHLSPFFSRMMDREYQEFRSLITQAKEIIDKEADSILETPEGTDQPDPAVIGCNMMLAPYAVAWGFMAAGMHMWQRSLAVMTEGAKPKRHLTLVHSR